MQAGVPIQLQGIANSESKSYTHAIGSFPSFKFVERLRLSLGTRTRMT